MDPDDGLLRLGLPGPQHSHVRWGQLYGSAQSLAVAQAFVSMDVIEHIVCPAADRECVYTKDRKVCVESAHHGPTACAWLHTATGVAK